MSYNVSHVPVTRHLVPSPCSFSFFPFHEQNSSQLLSSSFPFRVSSFLSKHVKMSKHVSTDQGLAVVHKGPRLDDLQSVGGCGVLTWASMVCTSKQRRMISSGGLAVILRKKLIPPFRYCKKCWRSQHTRSILESFTMLAVRRFITSLTILNLGPIIQSRMRTATFSPRCDSFTELKQLPVWGNGSTKEKCAVPRWKQSCQPPACFGMILKHRRKPQSCRLQRRCRGRRNAAQSAMQPAKCDGMALVWRVH